MKNLRQILLFYFIGVLLEGLTWVLFGRSLFLLMQVWIFWAVPVVFSVLGFLLGGAVYELMMKPGRKRKRIFIGSHIFCQLVLLVLLIMIFNPQANSEDPFPNRDFNRGVMRDFVRDHETYIRSAFDSLESSFSHPNDFRLESFFTRGRDTLVNGVSDTVVSVYFKYRLRDQPDRHYLSRFDVFAGVTTTLYLAADASTSYEYSKLRKESEFKTEEAMKSIDQSFRTLKDSLERKSAQ